MVRVMEILLIPVPINSKSKTHRREEQRAKSRSKICGRELAQPIQMINLDFILDDI